jgi:endonuclease-3
MKRSEKAERIVAMLEELYPETPVPLDHQNDFQLLVAVLMSAQTTDVKVNQVTPALFAKAPTPEAMVELSVETILNDIRQVGLAPTKAKNIRRLSELLIERHAGVVPQSFEHLENLPGVGHKTPPRCPLGFVQ